MSRKLMALAVAAGLVIGVGTTASAEATVAHPPRWGGYYGGYHGGYYAPRYYGPRAWVPGYWTVRPWGPRVWVGGYWR
jgi:hypothetical protein